MVEREDRVRACVRACGQGEEKRERMEMGMGRKVHLLSVLIGKTKSDE